MEALDVGSLPAGTLCLRKTFNLRLPDAIQAATALAIGADAFITHDTDFSRLTSLRVLC